MKKCLPNCSNPTTTTVYIYSGHQVIAVYDAHFASRMQLRDNGAAVGSPSREYILAGGTRLAKIAAGSTVYYHRDQVSTRLTTDSNGNVLSQQGHYPFGENWYQSGATPNSQPPNPPTTDQQFTTYQRDTESGNDYALAREFVNRLGRFSSPDPLAGDPSNPQSLNRYAYAANDPIDLLDPEGEYACITGCGLDLAMGIGGWDDFGDLGMLSIAATPTGIEWVAVQCQGGEGCVNGWTEIEKVDYDYSYLLDYLHRPGGGPGGDPTGPSGGNTSDPQKPNPKCNRQDPTNAEVLDFIQAHRADAQAIASQLSVPVQNILGLSAQESAYGQSSIAQNANNYFGLHAGAPGSTGTYTTSRGATVSAFPSATGYILSGQAFASTFGSLVQGQANAASFANSLVPKFNTANAKTGGNPDFRSAVTGAINAIASRLNCP